MRGYSFAQLITHSKEIMRIIDRAFVKASLLPGHVGSVQEAQAKISELYRLFHKNPTFRSISDAFLAWILTDPSTGALACFDQFAQLYPEVSRPWRELVRRVAASTSAGSTEPWLQLAQECKAAAEEAFQLSGSRGEVDFQTSCTRSVWSALGAAASVCETNALFSVEPGEASALASKSADQGKWATISRKKAEAFLLGKDYETVQRVEARVRERVGLRPRLKLFHMILENCDPKSEWSVREIRRQILLDLKNTEVSWQAVNSATSEETKSCI